MEIEKPESIPHHYYCHQCKKHFAVEDAKETTEPHGEVTYLCPKGHYEIE
jgi:predicted SprT family Zn-dependent metalloprotease